MLRNYSVKNVVFAPLLLILFIILGCGGPSLTKETINQDIYELLHEIHDSTYLVEADIIVTLQGERHSANFIGKKDQKLQIFKIYSPLIGDLVTLRATEDSLFLKYENRKISVLKSEGLNKLPFFSNYPFSFSIFTRILTERLPFTIEEILENGKYSEQGEGIIIRLEKENIYMKMTFEGRKFSNSSAVVSSINNEGWKLKYSKFDKGKFRKVAFNDQTGNGFILNFKN